MTQAKHWTFTDNNYEGLLDWEIFQDAGATFLLYQEEIGDSGTPHLQGMVSFSSKKRLEQVSALFGSNPHLELTRDIAASVRYCQKPEGRLGGPYQHGVQPLGQGSRADLVALKADLVAGANMRSISEVHFSSFIRYHNGIRQFRNLHTIRREWPMEIIIFVGPTGTGKSRTAWERYPLAYAKNQSRWWDGYDGHESVIVDEMGGHIFSHTELLKLLDRFPHSVEVKGGTTEFLSRTIVFTTNQEPEDWYDNEKFGFSWETSPLHRRIREYGTIIRTGEVHRRVRARLDYGQPQ